MKTFKQMLVMAGFATLLSFSGDLAAQGRGNFDPEEFRQRAMERYRERLEVKSEDEWKLIETRITKVMEARRELGGGAGGMAAFGRGGPGGRPGGGDAQRGGGGGGGFRGGEQSAEEQALDKAIEDKAPAEEIKAKLAKVREARKAKQANLEKAQEELRKVLSVRQEAISYRMGLLQ
jgi:hypothetical protein